MLTPTQNTYRHLFLHVNELGNLVDDLILDQRAIHIKHCEPLMTAEDAFLLEDNLNVPFSLKSPNTLVFPEISKSEIVRIWRWLKGNFDDPGLLVLVKASMRGIHALIRGRKGLDNLEEIGQA